MHSKQIDLWQRIVDLEDLRIQSSQHIILSPTVLLPLTSEK